MKRISLLGLVCIGGLALVCDHEAWASMFRKMPKITRQTADTGKGPGTPGYSAPSAALEQPGPDKSQKKTTRNIWAAIQSLDAKDANQRAVLWTVGQRLRARAGNVDQDIYNIVNNPAADWGNLRGTAVVGDTYINQCLGTTNWQNELEARIETTQASDYEAVCEKYMILLGVED